MTSRKNTKSKVGSFLNRVDPPETPIAGVSIDEMNSIVPRLDSDLQLMVTMACASGNKEHAQDIFLTACSAMYIRSLEMAKVRIVEELTKYFFVESMQDYITECLAMNEELDNAIQSALAMGFVVNVAPMPEWMPVEEFTAALGHMHNSSTG